MMCFMREQIHKAPGRGAACESEKEKGLRENSAGQLISG